MVALQIVMFSLVLMGIPTSHATSHTVGGDSGWSPTTDLSGWASGRTFVVGDTLVFNYRTGHGVDKVNQNDYSNCNTGSPISSYTDGETTISLDEAGPAFFICPTPGHCQLGGMKLSINVIVNAGGSTASGTGTSPPSIPVVPVRGPPPEPGDFPPPAGDISPPPPIGDTSPPPEYSIFPPPIGDFSPPPPKYGDFPPPIGDVSPPSPKYGDFPPPRGDIPSPSPQRGIFPPPVGYKSPPQNCFPPPYCNSLFMRCCSPNMPSGGTYGVTYRGAVARNINSLLVFGLSLVVAVILAS